MRVISPYNLKQRKIRRRNKTLRFIFLLFIVSLAFVGNHYYRSENNYYSNEPRHNESTAVKPVQKVLREFNGEELKDLYNNFRYANTNKIITLPSITGNADADTKIRKLADARGYRLRRIARDNLGNADGHPIQLIAEKPWLDLKAAAAKEGVVLTVTWAFRTLEDQRMIFLGGLSSLGVSTQDIANGKADSLVDKVLQSYAPPGYSRHHTGYTIDLTCGTNGLTNFATTECHDWLSRDNYANAKTYGWAPSYPDGASLQGPEPEPWEYVWVTVDALLE